MDIRRTILWMIFSLSLLLLWNNWQVHNGKASLFGTPAATQQTSEDTARAAEKAADTSIPSGVQASQPPAASADATVPGNASQSAPTSEKVEVKTDVYDLTFDTQGAQLVKASLLKYLAPGSKDEPMVLLDNS